MKIYHLLLAGIVLAAPAAATAQQSAQQGGFSAEAMAKSVPAPAVMAAPADPDAIPLYGAKTPGAKSTENWSALGGNVAVRNVTRPTLTPVLPTTAKATGAAVIIAPGGGFMSLSMETEGFQVAHALAARGIAAFVLKYRLVPTPVDEMEARVFSIKRIIVGLKEQGSGGESLRNPESTEDGLAAIQMVRAGAAKWGVDPARVGMIGFSAGAMTSLATGLAAQSSARPSFIGFVYGPQISVTVPADAPPLFDAIALDDPLFPTMNFAIVADWHKAKRPVELHAYGRGGHGFGGLGMKGTTTTLLIDEFVGWLSMQGFLSPTIKK